MEAALCIEKETKMAPFKSKAQARRFTELVKEGKMTQEEFDKWSAETPNMDELPDRLSEPKLTGLDRLKKMAKTKVIK